MNDLFSFDSFPMDVELSNELLIDLESDLMGVGANSSKIVTTDQTLFPLPASDDQQTPCSYGVVEDTAEEFAFWADGLSPQQYKVDWAGMTGHHPDTDWTIPESEIYRISSEDTQSSLTNTETMQISQEFITPTADTSSNAEKSSRLSQESVAILRNWLLAHQHQPCPSNEQQEHLRRRTGLSKKQLKNWFNNTRRRTKLQRSQFTSQGAKPSSQTQIVRPPTPAVQAMNPFERWRHSPPENEAVSTRAVAKAITFAAHLSESEHSSGHTCSNASSETYALSLYSTPSISSFSCTSQSGEELASSRFSQPSQVSGFRKKGRRHRCRRIGQSNLETISPTTPQKYQCTFCTETFKRRHDWQRHEKSLHLSSERWICAPNGPINLCPKTKVELCAYCGYKDADQAHLDTHHTTSCAGRSLEERTFYRKDHLRQHLKLRHNTTIQDHLFDSWKIETQSLKSRCGFCGTELASWSSRVDHLASHFKAGRDMSDWKGDWGFEPHVLDHVENGMAPYLIHVERRTLLPYRGSQENAQSRLTTYDLIKMGLVDLVDEKTTRGQSLTDYDLSVEARRILNSIDSTVENTSAQTPSWFNDLFLEVVVVDGEKSTKRHGMVHPRVRGLDYSVYVCPLERRLQSSVKSGKFIDNIPTDFELQNEASRVLFEIEADSTLPCDAASSWFNYLIFSSTHWLSTFRSRADILPSIGDASGRSDLVNLCLDHGLLDAADLMHRLAEQCTPINIEIQDGPTPVVLPTNHQDLHWNIFSCNTTSSIESNHDQQHPLLNNKPFLRKPLPLYPQTLTPVTLNRALTTPQYHSFSDYTNSYQRLTHKLSRFVASCLSPNNPAQHVPTDAEIQNQARWIIFDDDDPWNQTAADHAEWLAEFKRNVGLL
ncbi:hypothetical protein MMC17_007694 [Xylographa soralifera]|nr:hypothetical protein [Xylographa soralifera]